MLVLKAILLGLNYGPQLAIIFCIGGTYNNMMIHLFMHANLGKKSVIIRRNTNLPNFNLIPLEIMSKRKWSSHPEGWFCLNTDGSLKSSQGMATCGGLLRDHHGRWKIGFAKKWGALQPFLLSYGEFYRASVLLEIKVCKISCCK